ncbi:MAG: farnesyl diphosphate synthase [Clostridiaceae bacterium]|nr:farnesyl diphosphate synthase [Clostridiaceae bacterium]
MGETPKKLDKYAKMVEKRLDELFPNSESFADDLFSACRYSLLGGGKRLRPFLCLTFYSLCGGMSEDAISFASAIEMIHTYSLIHDDLPCMDDSDYRRGKLSCHKVYGYPQAVLAGDALLNRAFEVLSSPLANIQPSNVLSAMNAMAYASGIYGMIGGQMIDLSIEGKKCSKEQLWKMDELKTAVLIAGACKSGCCLAGADESKINAAYEYGKCLGVAFQIRDDMLDEAGDAALLGKPMGEDVKNGKNTFVSYYGMDKCEILIAELTEKAISYAESFGRGAAELKEIALWLTDRKY